MRLGRRIARHLLVLALCQAVFVLVLLAAARIPQDLVQDHMASSAAWYANRRQVEYLQDGVLATQLHYGADVIWNSISYGLGEGESLPAVMWARYYISSDVGLCEGLAQQVTGHLPGNVEYLRYWHGSAALVRALHLALDIRQIYALLQLAMAGLVAALVGTLWHRRMRGEAAALVVALAMVSAWIAPLCLEYVWMFLVMLVASLAALRVARSGRWERMERLMLLTGAVAAYLDFLTTETLTLLVPLMLGLRVAERGADGTPVVGRGLWRRVPGPCLCWFAGFAGTWVAKWVVASAALGIDVRPYVDAHVSERLAGEVGLPLPQFLWEAIARNVGRLFVLDYGVLGASAFVVLALVLTLPALQGRIRLATSPDRDAALLYALMGLVPYLRYLVLHNHSYGHYCFTYRAQAATVLALGLVALELLRRVPRLREHGDAPAVSGARPDAE